MCGCCGQDQLFQRLKAVELELQRTEMAEKQVGGGGADVTTMAGWLACVTCLLLAWWQAKAAAQQRKKLSRLERLAKPRAHATSSSSSPAASSPFR